MKSELIVDVQPSEVSIALLEDSRLMSLQKESRSQAYAVGDIYLAKVKKLMPGLNASFVNVGYEKDAFLHYLDLGPHFSAYKTFIKQLLENKKQLPQIAKIPSAPDIDKHGTISDQLTQGQELLVQIVKEPISSKGPRLTTEITFTGRYMVLIPFSDKISVSQKIKTSEEKVRLRQLIGSIKPKGFGVIIRTSAEGKRVAELNNELKTLLQCWEDTIAKARKATSAPMLVHEEGSRIVGVLRDLFSPTFEGIYVNDSEITEQIRKYVQLIAPERADIVKYHDSDVPIFDKYAVTRQIKSSFGKTVSFRSGAYIIIEHTEALHVIDVNSGNRAKATNDQETNALEVNMRAADEIARQLRLRDMGGIVVIDFIDMNTAEHRQQLYDHMREVMANDRARHNILPLSKFGLMQITRQRVRPALDITTTETCPSCFGKGVVAPSILFTDTLKEKLEYLIKVLGYKGFVMYVHPYVDAFLKKGIISMYRRWKLELGGRFKIMPDQSLPYLAYRVLDSGRNEIDLKEEKDTGSSSAVKTKTKVKTRGGEDRDTASDGSGDNTPATETVTDEEKNAKKRRRKPKKSGAETSADSPEQAETQSAPEPVIKAETTPAAEQTGDNGTAETDASGNDTDTSKPRPRRRRKPKAPKTVAEAPLALLPPHDETDDRPEPAKTDMNTADVATDRPDTSNGSPQTSDNL